MPDYNVCLVSPPGYQHSGCLRELAELLTFSLRDLGYSATLQTHCVDPDRRNIIIGCHLLDLQVAQHLRGDTVIVNTEQIYDQDPFDWKDTILGWAGRFETWDYSAANIDAFARIGVPGVKLLHLGHQPQLTRIVAAAEQDIDVLFYGSRTYRRRMIFEQLRARGLNVVTMLGVYGAERDSYTARAKLVLNLHNHPAQIFEVVRVHYLLSNAVAVVSEVNRGTSVPDYFRDAVAGVPYEGLVEECVRLVADGAARASLAWRGHEIIAAHPQTVYTRAVLG